ncbi:hypothetical protein [Streptomyces sp. NBC_01304]|uniref:hypothetical protein n=1 Tax=Streptomyces sp. NBC_01304 TaxID=2903818 RepID=UPI002E1033D2|nr:hypothetical protein OG430_19505 [Streptomyces sp. NBC_01304]
MSSTHRDVPLHTAPQRAPARSGGRRPPHRSLLGVCAAYVLVSAALVPVTLPLGWDEIVYASRFDPYAPATPFSAPRTRGVPLLLSPVASWSDSAVLLRVWLLLLAGGALYLGFRPWLRVLARRPSAVAVAAGLYGGLWFVLLYAGAAMPNHYTAMGAVGAVGCFVRQPPGRVGLLGIAAGLALATLMRPNDGAALALPLLFAALVVPAWRGRGRVPAVLGGVLAGVLPWLVEAESRFGGVGARLGAASEVQGGLRPVFSLFAHLDAFDGPLLCRPCAGAPVGPLAVEWFVVVPVLAGVGLRRAGAALAPLWLAVAVALAASAPYLLLVPYAAPRFLQPTHALLALPAALGLLAVVDRVRRAGSRRESRTESRTGPGRRLAALALTGLLAGHLSAHFTHAYSNARIQERARGDWQLIAQVLHEHGVGTGTGRPCVLKSSTSTIPIAYVTGCTPAPWGAAPKRPSAVVLLKRDPPRWAQDWPRYSVPGSYTPGWVVAIRP